MEDSPSKRQRTDAAQTQAPALLYNRAQETLCKVVFPEAYGKRDLRLFEAPEEVLACVQAGDNLRLIGEVNGDTVLCTRSRTFGLKKVETSNHIFFVGPSDSNDFSLELGVMKENEDNEDAERAVHRV